MAKKIIVEIPRSAVLELSKDIHFHTLLADAILHTENTGEPTQIKIGNARVKATVSISEG